MICAGSWASLFYQDHYFDRAIPSAYFLSVEKLKMNLSMNGLVF
jgi:hypothetical protein